jgi:hypothetical protein
MDPDEMWPMVVVPVRDKPMADVTMSFGRTLHVYKSLVLVAIVYDLDEFYCSGIFW